MKLVPVADIGGLLVSSLLEPRRFDYLEAWRIPLADFKLLPPRERLPFEAVSTAKPLTPMDAD